MNKHTPLWVIGGGILGYFLGNWALAIIFCIFLLSIYCKTKRYKKLAKEFRYAEEKIKSGMPNKEN